jgi:Lipid A 3-O-deacylase (PagL)
VPSNNRIKAAPRRYVMLRHVVCRVLCVASLFLMAHDAFAGEGDRNGFQSFGLRLAYGVGSRDNLKFFSVVPRLSMYLPEGIDRFLAAYHLDAEWVSEVIVSSITNRSSTLEAGLNPLFFSLRYDRGQALVPFVEGGEGVLYSNLLGERLGSRFQFSSEAGGGLHWFIDKNLAVTAAYRLRHMSNGGIARQNSGLNTDFYMIGVTYFPRR